MYYLYHLGGATVSGYSYDLDNEEWCELTLSFNVSERPIDMSNVIKKACAKGIIKEIKNIKR